ncbi:MAG: sodium:proton antiporter [bacterium]|nr:sodium:proton antiporter [bacterium]
MSLFALLAVMITATALLSYANERVFRLPPTIGVMVGALLLSVALTLLGQAGLVVDRWAEELFLEIDFDAVLMRGMLSFLLFAGALHVDLNALFDRKWTILSLATVGVALSTFIVGTLFWFGLGLFGLELPYIWALLFGALISPTDPIAVLGILRDAEAPESLESLIIGESLFNDGVGVVVFSVILGVAVGGHELSAAGVGLLFLEEAVGGVLFGLALGYAAYRMLRTVDNYAVEVLITLALVSGGYALAGALHTSGPIAMVVAGLFIGNHGRVFGMSELTRQRLDDFWEMVDEILNALLFVMIGFELLVLEASPNVIRLGLAAIPLVLGVRLFCVSLPLGVLRELPGASPRTAVLMAWGGIRGGISIALALALPPTPERDVLLVVTYTVVVFSILVQGLTVGRVTRWATKKS